MQMLPTVMVREVMLVMLLIIVPEAGDSAAVTDSNSCCATFQSHRQESNSHVDDESLSGFLRGLFFC